MRLKGGAKGENEKGTNIRMSIIYWYMFATASMEARALPRFMEARASKRAGFESRMVLAVFDNVGARNGFDAAGADFFEAR